MSMVQLPEWESELRSSLSVVEPDKLSRSGGLLGLVPDHTRWEDFLSSVRAGRSAWKNDFRRYPACLVLLYSGLAFFKYDDNTFWPQFARAVGENAIPTNKQTEINQAFGLSARDFGLPIRRNTRGIDFVGSAIAYIGIPLSLWDGFLDICEWALWRNDWNALSTEEWADAIERRAGGRRRLKRFLIDNRETARDFVKELLDAREILSNDPHLTIRDISQASILRMEYFDEVPETADFLRPQNPDSLFQDRARVALDENHQQIYLRVPAVESKKLPALWRVKAVVMDAASTADRLALNSEAFTNPLMLSLESEGHTDTQRVLGPEPWGLFDMERGGGLVNPNRDVLPIASYVLLSSKPIQFSRKGFEETENPINEQFELVDGTICSITRLLPTGKNAELLIEDASQTRKTIQFKTKARIEARFYAGESRRAGFFNRKDGITRVEQWPVLCVSIPNGYFRNDLAQLNSGFKVYIDNDLAGGKWESKPVRRADDRNYYLWKWSGGNPVMRQTGERASSLQDIGKIVSFPDLRGKRTLAIKSVNFTEQYEIEMLSQVPAIAESWKSLPGSYLPMFLLCQSDVGLKWEDLLLVKDVIAPDSQISYHVLRKYYEHGILVQRNRKWSIEQSRYALKPFDHVCQLDYCGDPSILWGLYRRMHDVGQRRHSLPVIEIVNKRGKIPYLHMDWPMHFQLDIEKYLKNHQAIEGDTLWMH